MLEFKEEKVINHQSRSYFSLAIFNLSNDISADDNKILDWLIHSIYYQWNYKNYPNGLNGDKIHGPFLIDKIHSDDYNKISRDQMLSEINNTIRNEIYFEEHDKKRQDTNQKFQNEVDALLNGLPKECLGYYHLNFELTTEDEGSRDYDKMSEWSPFSFFSSYVVISKTQLFLIELGED